MAGVVASKVRRARVKSLIDKEEQNGKGSIAINPLQECTNRRGFQDVLVIQMLAGCTSGISSALIG